jgi:DNA polymerase I
MVVAMRGTNLPIVIEGYDTGALQRMVNIYRERGTPILFDTETTERNPRRDKLVCLQFRQVGSERVTVLDVRALNDVMLANYGYILSPLFNGSLLIIGQNLKFDMQFLKEKMGLRIPRLFDVMLAEQVIYGVGWSEANESGIPLSLKGIAERRGITVEKETRSFFFNLDQRPEWDEPLPEDVLRYADQDVTVLEQIYISQLEEIRRLGLFKAAKLEFRVLPAMGEIELNGIYINPTNWMQVIEEQKVLARQYEEEALEVFGPAILEWRTERFDAALEEYNAWVALRDMVEERAKDFWDLAQVPQDTTLPGMALVKPEYVQFLPNPGEAWGKYKVRIMQAFRETNPNPGKPKPDTSLPNLGSVQQLRAAFEKLGIPVQSTDSEYLEQIEDDYPAVHILLKWRKCSKIVQAFGQKIIDRIDPLTGRIHPNYIVIGAGTDRNACEQPNWQQVPSEGVGKQLRACVVAQQEGWVMMVADFSNIELRILAFYSRDETMLRFFAEGKDLHSETARMMFSLGPDDDPKKICFPGTDIPLRKIAKTINFGLIYGMSPNKLARTLRITVEKAKELFDAYFKLYPGVSQWLREMREDGVRTLCSRTLSGWTRRYKMPSEPVMPRPVGGRMPTEAYQEYREALREWRGHRARIERQSTNTPIQGSSACMTKLAVCLLHERLLASGLHAMIVGVVHDEIVVECLEADAGQVSTLIADCMDEAVKTYLGDVVFVPRADVVVSDHWAKE